MRGCSSSRSCGESGLAPAARGQDTCNQPLPNRQICRRVLCVGHWVSSAPTMWPPPETYTACAAAPPDPPGALPAAPAVSTAPARRPAWLPRVAAALRGEPQRDQPGGHATQEDAGAAVGLADRGGPLGLQVEVLGGGKGHGGLGVLGELLAEVLHGRSFGIGPSCPTGRS